VTKVLPNTALMTMDVPIQPKLNLFVELGGGNLALDSDEDRGSGWANFIMGLRTYLKGSGGRGTLILTTGMGLAYVWDQTSLTEFEPEGGSAWGMLLDLGLEWRI
jgi:hypothetical protein